MVCTGGSSNITTPDGMSMSAWISSRMSPRELEILGRTAVASAGIAVLGQPEAMPAAVARADQVGENLVDVVLTVNERTERLRMDPRVTLLDPLPVAAIRFLSISGRVSR